MSPFGGYRELAPSARLLGCAVFIGMLWVATVLERLQFQLKASESSTWWASNGRDVVNAFALGAMSVGLHVIGFSGPVALTLAATLVVLLSTLQPAFENHRLASWLSMSASLALAWPVLVFPRLVHDVFERALTLLFQ